jgi:hypothetical protein
MITLRTFNLLKSIMRGLHMIGQSNTKLMLTKVE